jgi:ankyrin repeat protein
VSGFRTEKGLPDNNQCCLRDPSLQAQQPKEGEMFHSLQALRALAIAAVLLTPLTASAETRVDASLREASRSGDVAEMQHELELGADPDQAYALVAAVQGNQAAAVEYLLAHGADPNAWTRLNLRIPLGAAESPMFLAARQGNREILRSLKNHGADVNAEWQRAGSLAETALNLAIQAGDTRAVQLLIECGADVNHVPQGGNPPLIAALRSSNGADLARLLLSHGANPDIKNAPGESARQLWRNDAEISALIERQKPATAALLEPEEPLVVAMALHYKALCDAALPGYRAQVAGDYARWRGSQAKAISQLESSAEFNRQQAEAKSAFDAAQAEAAQAGEGERQRQAQMLQRICEVGLVDQFRFGTPVLASAAAAIPPAQIQAAPSTAVQTVTVHRTAQPPVAGGGMMSHP